MPSPLQGYFQLKANPGTWYLRIREGRSSELYNIASTENTEKSGSDVAVLVTNFRAKVGSANALYSIGDSAIPVGDHLSVSRSNCFSTIPEQVLKVRAEKKPGKAHEELLVDEDEDEGIWNSITR